MANHMQFLVNGQTRSKFYSSQRFIDDNIHCRDKIYPLGGTEDNMNRCLWKRAQGLHDFESI